MTVLEARNLTRVYRLRTGHEIVALQGVSARFARGAWTTVIGPSGSGKSSLLSLLATLDRPTSGNVLVDGQEISFASDVRQSRYRRERIGVVFQEYQLVENVTAWENVAMPLVVTAMGRRQRWQRAVTLLERVGLAERTDHFPRQLSGGERQRVALARALVHDPQILFADEPTSNIDDLAAGLVCTLFEELRRLGHTLIVVSHDQELKQRADQVLQLEQGRLVP